ncbi:MAG: IS1595 family transposase [Pseudomonadota bacterium]
MSMFNAPHFQTVEAAREYLESLRWGGERVCPHCGTVNSSFATKKPGVYRCSSKECRKDFSVTTKSVMESSHIRLNVWLQAFFLMASSKKGISSHQLHRTLGITYKSAWFLTHRIREAMRAGGLMPPLGGKGAEVEADETYFGPVAKDKKRTTKADGSKFTKGGKSGPSNKRAIVSLVERGGEVRSFHVAVADKATVTKIVTDNIHHETILYTDESRLYTGLAFDFDGHETVKHSIGEYVRGVVHTNTIEGVFSIFKRGMKGNYQHCAEKHLHRYLAEFDFRYNHRVKLGFNDGERADLAIKGAAGKRLTYRQTN